MRRVGSYPATGEPHVTDKGERACERCVYWEQLLSDKARGACRRHAPTGSGFHVTYAGEWCGDFADEWGTIVNRRAQVNLHKHEMEELAAALRESLRDPIDDGVPTLTAEEIAEGLEEERLARGNKDAQA